MNPIWYVVLYADSPPRAVPVSMALAKDAYCERLNAAKRLFVVYDVAAASSSERRLLEALLSVSADERMRALVALNRIRLVADEWRFSFWACSICDGGLNRPSACGCCARPDCGVRCGCRDPIEFAACGRCGERIAECDCVNDDREEDCEICDGCGKREYITELGFCVRCVAELGLKYGDEECIVCGRPGDLNAADWCRNCRSRHAYETEEFCRGCEREPSGHCPACDSE
jgi:hypothetical protein